MASLSSTQQPHILKETAPEFSQLPLWDRLSRLFRMTLLSADGPQWVSLPPERVTLN